MPLVQRPGDLIEVVSDAPVFGGQLSKRGKQLVVDRGNRDNGTDAHALNGSADKLGLTDAVGRKAGGKVGYSSSVSRVLTTRFRRGVSYFLRGMGFTSFHLFL